MLKRIFLLAVCFCAVLPRTTSAQSLQVAAVTIALDGLDLKTLYITAGGTLYKVQTKSVGTRR